MPKRPTVGMIAKGLDCECDNMKIATLYASSFGHTEKVVKSFLKEFPYQSTIFQAPLSSDLLKPFDVFIFFCPTYGDDELHLDFEQTLISLQLPACSYALCELGNYYGYDDFQFGPARIVRPYLAERRWHEIIEPLSLDALPKINWPALWKWRKELIVKLS